MTKEKNLTELANSYYFQCRGATKTAGNPALDKEKAVPVIVKIYRDGESEAECTCLVKGSCEGATNEEDYGKCPYVTKARKK